jgi:hypothetical protein
MRNREEIMNSARIDTNLAYLLVDVANTLIKTADSKLDKIGMQLKFGEKYAFNRAKREIKKMDAMTKELCKPIYNLKEVDDACEDSDWLYDYLRLLIDRTGDSPELMEKVKKHLVEMDSKLNYY